MGEESLCICDGEDCYKQAMGVALHSAHEVAGGIWGDEHEGWAAISKKVPFNEEFPGSYVDLMIDVNRTYCRECAIYVNFQKLRDDGWTVVLPEGFVESRHCEDCDGRGHHSSGKFGEPDYNFAQCEADGCLHGFITEGKPGYVKQ